MANTYSIDLERGSSQYLSRADTASLSLTGDFTFEAWVKLETDMASVRQDLMAKWTGAGNQRSFQLFLERNTGTDRIFFANSSDGVDNGTTATVDFASNLVIGTWYHIAMTFDASAGQIELFLYGTSVTTGAGAATSTFDSTAVFNLGADSGATTFFDGLLDEVRIWDDIRSGAEISANYQSELTGSEAGLVAYWKLNNDATDSQTSGNNDLTLQAAPSYSVDTPFIGPGEFTADGDTTGLWHMDGAIASAAKKDNAEGSAGYDLTETSAPTSNTGFNGIANGCYVFDGSAELVETTNNFTAYGASAVTVECWIKTTTDNGNSIIVGINDGVTETFALRKSAAGNTYFFRCETSVGTGDSPTIAEASIEDGGWHYLAGTYDGASVEIYLDGVRQSTGTAHTGTIITSNAANLSIGATEGGTSLWAGSVDEVRISDIARSATVISNYYNQVTSTFVPKIMMI